MDQVYVVRHKVLVEKQSERAVGRELGISRNTVKTYVEGEVEPGVRKATARATPVLDEVKPKIEKLLDEWSTRVVGKQRITATRVHRALRDAGVEVGETTVKACLREFKRQKQEVFVPLEYPPGDLAQVDFFEVVVEVDGRRRKAWLFVMRLMHSGRDFARLCPRQDQVCFLDGHVRAFAQSSTRSEEGAGRIGARARAALLRARHIMLESNRTRHLRRKRSDRSRRIQRCSMRSMR